MLSAALLVALRALERAARSLLAPRDHGALAAARAALVAAGAEREER